MNEADEFRKQLKDNEDQLVKLLTDAGLTLEEAKASTRQQIENMGITRVLDRKCPVHAKNPMACMFCCYGHLTECHFPKT